MKRVSECVFQDIIYYLGMLFGCAGILGVLVIKICGVDFLNMPFSCPFHQVTGYYCCGCGGPRAVYFLLKGDFLKSFTYNPIVLYMFGVYLFFMITNFFRRYFSSEFPCMIMRPIYAYIGIVIIIGQCILKNFLLFLGNM